MAVCFPVLRESLRKLRGDALLLPVRVSDIVHASFVSFIGMFAFGKRGLYVDQWHGKPILMFDFVFGQFVSRRDVLLSGTTVQVSSQKSPFEISARELGLYVPHNRASVSELTARCDLLAKTELPPRFGFPTIPNVLSVRYKCERFLWEA